MFTLENVKHELEHACDAPFTSKNAHDFASLLIIHDHLCGKHKADKHEKAWDEKHEHHEEHAEHVPFNKEVAMSWVHGLKNTDKDHPTGPRWTPEEVMPLAEKVGFPKTGDDFWMFYAVMNALRSDYYAIAQKYGLHNNPMFFADLTAAWFDDEDAVEDKAEMYYKYVMKH